MSKLATALYPRVISESDDLLSEHLEVTRRTESNPTSQGTDYMLEARLFTRVRISAKEHEACVSDPALRERVFQTARQNIVEAVFGEFREPLAKLQHALVAGDLEKSRALARELQTQMFYVGIPQ
jgi:hypothetical protein